MSDLPIPKINPSNSESPPVTNENLVKPISKTVDGATTGDSILIPKTGSPMIQKPQEPVKNFEMSKQGKPPMNPKYKKIFMGIGIFLIVLFVAILIPGFFLFQSGKRLAASSNKLVDAGKAGDFATMKSELPNVKKSLSSFRASYTFISWTKFVPFMGGYVSDLGHGIKSAEAGLDAFDILLTASEPYVNILGLAGASDGGGEKTTQERIDFMIKAIPDILPKIDELGSKVQIVQTQFSMINPDRYPENYKGTEVRSKIISLQDILAQASTFVVNGKPVLEATPYLLGMDSPRTYLVLFQNDKELRPTGGFMTAYTIMKVDKAKFEPVNSDDIYNLDAKYKPSIPAPDPIVKYIKGPYVLSKNLRLRDMNWSPDFVGSMEGVTQAVNEVGVKDFDGIIAVDTQLLVNLLNVIGPIGVPGFGNFSTETSAECNCPQVIHELESFADIEGPIIWDPLTGKIIQRPPNSDNRKKIIGPLMNSILANALGQPKEKLPDLFGAGFTSIMEKHVLFYIYDDNTQNALSDFGLSGKIVDYEGDYLHINDANLGGRKSNLYVTQEVLQEIEVKRDGTVEKTVTITYKNPEKHDGWLNSVLPNWVRVYVPKGSQLIASEGLEDKSEPYDDLNKTVFSGLFQLRPEGVSKVTFKYTLPQKVSKEYKLLIQKQPGTDAPLYTVILGRHEEEFLLKVDKELKIRI